MEVLRSATCTRRSVVGLSRRYRSDGLSVARWRAERAVGERPQVLLVANPTGDLPGADDEGRRLHRCAVATRPRGAERGWRRRRCVGRAGCDGFRRLRRLHFAGHGHF